MLSSPSLPPRARPTRRSLLTGAGGLTAALALGACTGPAGRQEVVFYQSKPEAIPYFTDLAQQFNQSQDRFSVLHDIATNLSAAFVRANPPDLGCLNYNLEMGRFMERGALSDLADMDAATRIRADVAELADWYPTYEGRTSVIPYSITAASVIYNQDLFAEHGVEVPTTWSSFLTACETFQDAGVTPIYGTFLDPWTVAQGLIDYTVGGLIDVRAFYQRMHEIGADVGPDSETSFAKDWAPAMEKLTALLPFHNRDAVNRGYGDGNTAIARGQAAMLLQGPWAFAEIAKAEPEATFGTFPLPVTESPDDLRVRVNIDLSLWVPETADAPEGARAFLDFLMQPEVQNAYNAEFLAFGTTEDAPPVTDERIVGMREFYDSGRFYMGPSQFIQRSIPAENYFQSIATGADPHAVLTQLDRDWASLAFRGA